MVLIFGNLQHVSAVHVAILREAIQWIKMIKIIKLLK